MIRRALDWTKGLLFKKSDRPSRVKFWVSWGTSAVFMAAAFLIISVMAAIAVSPHIAAEFAKEGLEIHYSSLNELLMSNAFFAVMFWGVLGAVLAMSAYGHADTKAKNILAVGAFALGAPFAAIAVLLWAAVTGALLLAALVMGLILTGAAADGSDGVDIQMSNNSDYATGAVKENGRYVSFVDEYGREHPIERVDKSGANPIIIANNGQKYEKVAGYDNRWKEIKQPDN